MGEITKNDYQTLIEGIKGLIQQKQYQILKKMNAETINLYWEIGEEIYRQQQEKGWGKSVVNVLSVELQNAFPGANGYIKTLKNSHHWCEKLVGAIILSLWKNAKMIWKKNFIFRWQKDTDGQSAY